MSDFSNPIFHDETKAREWLEARVWRHGRVCPKCGVVDQSTLMKGKTTRPGLYQCNACREPFTVTVGTLYERSKVPLHKWLAVTHLMMASKKGMSALQISRMLGLSYKTTWFLCHRIRESLRPDESLPEHGRREHACRGRRDVRGRQGKEPCVPRAGAEKARAGACRARRRPRAQFPRRQRHGKSRSSRSSRRTWTRRRRS